MKNVCAALFLSFFIGEVVAQCNPAIPSTAIVVSTKMTINSGINSIWVCSGDTLISNGGIHDVFLEQGAVMTTGGGINTVYVMNGAKFTMTGGIHDIYFENFADLTLSGGISTPILCPVLTYNYTNAPVNGCPPSVPVSGTIAATDPTCIGSCDGSATVSGTGGIPPTLFNGSVGRPDQLIIISAQVTIPLK